MSYQIAEKMRARSTSGIDSGRRKCRINVKTAISCTFLVDRPVGFYRANRERTLTERSYSCRFLANHTNRSLRSSGQRRFESTAPEDTNTELQTANRR